MLEISTMKGEIRDKALKGRMVVESLGRILNCRSNSAEITKDKGPILFY